MTRPIIWLATTNTFKVKEYKKLLPNYEIKSISDLPKEYYETSEEGTTFGENALLKAKDLAHFINGMALGDDSGIEVVALNNFPGIYSRRWALPETDWNKINKKLLELVARSKAPNNLNATMTTALALYDARSGKHKIFEAQVRGTLVDNFDARSGVVFGYDPIFIPQGHTLPYDQIPLSEKNRSSPRGIVVKQLIKYLKGNNNNHGAKD